MRGDGARHAGHVRHAADDAHQAGEMATVAHPQLEGEHRGVGILLVDGNVIDVGLGAGDRCRHRRQHAGAVDDIDADLGGEDAIGRGLPAHRQPLLRVLAVVLDVDAVLAVDHDAAPGGKEGEDRVVGNREAAARVGNEQSLGAGNGERRKSGGSARGRGRRQQPPRNQRCEALAEPDLLVELIEILEAELAERRTAHLFAHILERERELAERLREELGAERDRLAATQALEVMADGAARLRGRDEVDPGGVGGRTLGGDDLDLLAVAQHGAQRRQAPVDLGGDAAVADVGVHRVGEIHDRGPGGQAQDLPLGREHVDLVGEQVDLDALEKLLRGAGFLQRHEVRDPLARALLLHGAGIAARFVPPVRGDTGLGDAVHVASADLRFDRHAVRAEERRVQRLVAVGARDGDVVLEAPRHRLENRVHDAERAVAGLGAVDDDAQAVDIDDLAEQRALAAHLAVDAVEVLLARLDVRGNLGLHERGIQLLLDLLEELLLVAARALQRALEHQVTARVERLEAEVLELELHVVEAEPFGDRRVDLERLAGDRPASRRRHGRDGAHVVRAVGELHQDDAQVAHHGEQHLAERFRLRLLAALELDLVELGDAIDDLGDSGAEALRQLVLRCRGVLDDIVEDGGDDRVGVEMEVGEDRGGGDRVGDERLTREALLAAVDRGAEFGRLANAAHLLGGQVAADGAQQLLQSRSASSAGQ